MTHKYYPTINVGEYDPYAVSDYAYTFLILHQITLIIVITNVQNYTFPAAGKISP